MSGVLHLSSEVAIAPREAFECFTRSELLEEFFTVQAEVEPRAGGKYELDWDPDSGSDQGTIGCRIAAISENKLVAFDWKGPPPHSEVMNNADPLIHVTVMFYPIEKSGSTWTDIHLLHSGWGTVSAWETAIDYFDINWKIVLDSLVDTVKGS